MQLDGKPEESVKVKRTRLTTQINNYEQMLNLTTPQEDPILFKSLHDHIAAAKSAVILLNPPEEQLTNLQGAIQRKRKFAMSLTSQVSDLQSQLQKLDTEVSDLLILEKKLQDQLAPVHIVPDEPDNDQYLQLKLQHSALEQKFEKEKMQTVELLQHLQTIPGMPEIALSMIPQTLGVPAPKTPVDAVAPGNTDPLRPAVVSPLLQPLAQPAGSVTFPTGFEGFDQDDHYGKSPAPHLRPSPYGAAAETTPTETPTEVFRDAANKEAEA